MRRKPQVLSPEKITCLNCGDRYTGSFCNSCGQAAAVEPFTIRSFGMEFFRNIRKFDITTTFFTFVELLAEPGEFVRAFLAGKRVGFISPFKFYIYALLVQVIFLSFLRNLTTDEAFSPGLAGDPWVQFFGLVSTIFWGIFWALFYRGSLKGVAEYAACSLYFSGQNIFLGTLIVISTSPLREGLPLTGTFILPVQMIVMAGYSFYFAKELFQEPWWKVLLKQAGLFLIYVILLSAMVLAYGTWLNRVGQ